MSPINFDLKRIQESLGTKAYTDKMTEKADEDITSEAATLKKWNFWLLKF